MTTYATFKDYTIMLFGQIIQRRPKMTDKRAFWKTKTFWGAVAFAAVLISEAAGIVVPIEAYGLITVYTGYSIADRLRK